MAPPQHCAAVSHPIIGTYPNPKHTSSLRSNGLVINHISYIQKNIYSLSYYLTSKQFYHQVAFFQHPGVGKLSKNHISTTATQWYNLYLACSINLFTNIRDQVSITLFVEWQLTTYLKLYEIRYQSLQFVEWQPSPFSNTQLPQIPSTSYTLVFSIGFCICILYRSIPICWNILLFLIISSYLLMSLNDL